MKPTRKKSITLRWLPQRIVLKRLPVNMYVPWLTRPERSPIAASTHMTKRLSKTLPASLSHPGRQLQHQHRLIWHEPGGAVLFGTGDRSAAPALPADPV